MTAGALSTEFRPRVWHQEAIPFGLAFLVAPVVIYFVVSFGSPGWAFTLTLLLSGALWGGESIALRNEQDQWQRHRDGQMQTLRQKIDRVLERGTIGEREVEQQASNWLKNALPDNSYRGLGGLLVRKPNVAADDPIPRAEMDYVAVTPGGVVVIEAKNRGGELSYDAALGWRLRYQDQTYQETTDPVAQNEAKVRLLKTLLGEAIPIHSLVVSTKGAVAQDLPLHVIPVADLPYCLRRIVFERGRETWLSPDEIGAIADELEARGSATEEEFYEHRRQVARVHDPEGEFLTLDNEHERLKKEGPPPVKLVWVSIRFKVVIGSFLVALACGLYSRWHPLPVDSLAVKTAISEPADTKTAKSSPAKPSNKSRGQKKQQGTPNAH